MRILMLLTKPVLQDARVLREARALKGAGHEVTVLQWARHEPGAKRHEVHQGIRIERRLDGRVARAAGRMVHSDVVRERSWWRAGTREARAMHAAHPFHVVHAHDLDTLPIAVRLKGALGIPVVFDAHEIFPLMLHPNRPLMWAAAWLERRLLRRVDAIITVNAALAAQYEKSGKPVRVVENCPDVPARAKAPSGPFSVVYVGVLERARLFPDAVHALGAAEIPFTIAGKREAMYTQTETAARAYASARFLGTIAHDEVWDATLAGHAVLCMFDPSSPLHRIGSPNKLYEAMAAGRPLIASAGTYVGDFVQAHGVGIVAPHDIEGLRKAALHLRDHPNEARAMGKRGRTLARSIYNWPKQAEHLLELYAEAPWATS